MITIRKAKEIDKPKLLKLARRIEGSAKYEDIVYPVPSLAEKEIDEHICRGETFIAMEKSIIVSLAIVQKDVSSYFYPNSHSEGQLMEIVAKTDARMSEDMLALVFLGTDPMCRNKGIATSLLHSIEATFPRFLFLASLDISNQPGIEYLRKNGYKKVDLEKFEFSSIAQQLLFKRT